MLAAFTQSLYTSSEAKQKKWNMSERDNKNLLFLGDNLDILKLHGVRPSPWQTQESSPVSV